MPVGTVRRDQETSAFFDGTAAGEFLVNVCGGCGGASEPQAILCPHCHRDALELRRASGDATVVSWTVVHGRPSADDRPERSVVAIGQLAEGPWWWSRVVDADPDTIRVGAPLRITFERGSDGEAVPQFHLA